MLLVRWRDDRRAERRRIRVRRLVLAGPADRRSVLRPPDPQQRASEVTPAVALWHAQRQSSDGRGGLSEGTFGTGVDLIDILKIALGASASPKNPFGAFAGATLFGEDPGFTSYDE